MLLQKHNIPVSAVPCLQYRRALEAESLRANEPQQSLDSARGGEEEALWSIDIVWVDYTSF